MRWGFPQTCGQPNAVGSPVPVLVGRCWGQKGPELDFWDTHHHPIPEDPPLDLGLMIETTEPTDHSGLPSAHRGPFWISEDQSSDSFLAPL